MFRTIKVRLDRMKRGYAVLANSKKKCFILIIVLVVTLIFGAGLVIGLAVKTSEENAHESMRSQMDISDESIVETYFIRGEECALVNVIEREIYNERLFFMTKDGDSVSCKELEEAIGLTDTIEVNIHPWEDKIFVEVACSTNKGNGDIFIYELENQELELLLTAGGAVDRNLDTTTNAVYENGKLHFSLQESEGQDVMPQLVFKGTQWVYGYEVKGDASGEELLYQRNAVRHVYEWDGENGEYIESEKVTELIEQVEGVYPISSCW